MLSVVTPASSRRLTTLPAVWRDLDLSAGPADLYLNDMIAEASDAVATFCGRDLGVQSYVETFRDSFGDVILSAWPVVSVSAIKVDGTPIDLTAALLDTRTGIIGMPHRGLCRHHRGDVAVTYSAGYVLPVDPASNDRTLPSDIERAVLLLIKSAYLGRTRDPALRSEEVTGIGTVSYGLAGMNRDGTLPPDVEGLLQRYRAVTSG